jgi:hypothetical protein
LLLSCGAALQLWEEAAPTLLGDAKPMPLIPTVTDFDWRYAALAAGGREAPESAGGSEEAERLSAHPGGVISG